MRRPFIVAEVSGNHLQSRTMAQALVLNAARCGADAVKFQCWSPGSMAMGGHTIADGLWAGQRLEDLYAKTHTPWEWFPELFALASENGIEAFASVFDQKALEFLELQGCPRYKIASAELVDIPLIKDVASTGKPMIMSTGMATRAEIHEAWEAALLSGCPDVTLLHCVSAYPTGPAGVNMNTMLDMGQLYRGRAKIGYSDHTQGIGAAVLASALGASMIEKHITGSHQAPDAAFSLFADEFSRMVKECRAAAQMMGTVSYGPQPGDITSLRRGLYYARDLPAGHKLEPQDLTTARPAVPSSVKPISASKLVGLHICQPVAKGDPVNVLDVHIPLPSGESPIVVNDSAAVG